MAFFPSNFMLQASHEDDNHTPFFLSPILQPCSNAQDFHGVESFLDKRSMTTSNYGTTDACDQETNVDNPINNINININNGDQLDEVSDDGLLLFGERKKRLNMEQVKTLERNFELGNKLDPERKMQLARALGLQPRQIAIWFQNRRARWKTKKLEKEYDVLKKQFEAIKAQNDCLVSQNHKLQAQITQLKNKEPTESINLNIKENEGSCSNKSDHKSTSKLDITRTTITTMPSQHHEQQPITSCLSQSSIVDHSSHQIFHNSSSRSEYHHHHLHAQKLDQHVNNKDHESLCNLFLGIEDQSGFWPWLEQPPQFN